MTDFAQFLHIMSTNKYYTAHKKTAMHSGFLYIAGHITQTTYMCGCSCPAIVETGHAPSLQAVSKPASANYYFTFLKLTLNIGSYSFSY